MHISIPQILASFVAITSFTPSSIEVNASVLPTRAQHNTKNDNSRKSSNTKSTATITSAVLTAVEYQNYAASVINSLQVHYYSETFGLWGTLPTATTGFIGDWWNSANVLTMLASYYGAYPDTASFMTSMFASILTNAPTHGYVFTGFLDDFYDDELWWALAWIQVYDATGNSTYLDMAVQIYSDADSIWGNTPCGGLWWDKPHTAVNTVETELYLTASAKLASRITSKTTTDGTNYYLSRAKLAYAFLVTDSTKTINPDTYLFNDHIDIATCVNDNSTIFTYNQGIILSGLITMTDLTGDATYTTLAVNIANSVLENLTTDGILVEKACESTGCDTDEAQFKGVFTRHLTYVVQHATGVDPATIANYKTFLQRNAQTIIQNDDNGDAQLGLVWSGGGGVNLETDASGLDTLVGAMIVSA